MARSRVLRPVGHDDRLSIVDHLDELRSRLIVCGAALVVAFGLCYWQSEGLLHLLNRPLPANIKAAANHLSGLTSDSVKAAHDFGRAAIGLHQLAALGHQTAATRSLLNSIASNVAAASRALPQSTPKNVPITIGVGEPFTTTLTVCFYFALLLTLPVLLYQAYAFVIPALSPNERRIALPIMIAAPILFVIGVVFTYVVILPAAIRFLQGYHSS